jgi:putative SOS response-associated peptidase YedK
VPGPSSGRGAALGLVVQASDKVHPLRSTFNARAEDVANKPMFLDAFKRHRCIIPASGYYEWIKRPDGKQPYFS